MPGEPFFFFGGVAASVPGGPSVAPTQPETLTVLRAFLLNILPPLTDIIKAQVNRVPEPKHPDFVVMTPIRRDRIETNTDAYADIQLEGTISGTTLNVTALKGGTLKIGMSVYADGIALGTKITGFQSGYGALGTYTVSLSQTWPPSSAIGFFIIGTSPIESAGLYPLYCGSSTFTQPTKLTVQLDVHGPNSSENAQIISTLFRDAYAVDFMAPSVSPLYADDPKQVPFINDQQQYEDRWIVEAAMQVDPVVSVSGQQFFDRATVGFVEIDTTYS